MKSCNRIFIILCLMGSALIPAVVATSCKPGRSELPKRQQGQNLTKDAIDRNILALDDQEWEPGLYHEILTNQINQALNLDEVKEKTPLRKKLAEHASDQLVRCLSAALENNCAQNHDRIRAMNDSLKALAPALGDYHQSERELLAAKVSEHNTMLSFSVATSVGSGAWKNPYDYSYDSGRRKLATQYRAKNPKCTAIQQRISQQYVDNCLRKRHDSYDRQVEQHRNDTEPGTAY